MSQSQVLYRLQQIDSQLDQARIHSAEIEKTLAGNRELDLAKAGLMDAQQRFNTEASELLQAEKLVHDQCIKIKQTEAALYGGKIRIPKELQDLQNELASLKKHLIVLEDRQIEHMEAVEAMQGNLFDVDAHYNLVLASWVEQIAQLKNEQSQIQTLIVRLDSERIAALSPIPTELLSIYENLRNQRNGTAVIKVSGKSCSACGTTLSPAIIQSVQSSPGIVRCPSCNRILYSG